MVIVIKASFPGEKEHIGIQGKRETYHVALFAIICGKEVCGERHSLLEGRNAVFQAGGQVVSKGEEKTRLKKIAAHEQYVE